MDTLIISTALNLLIFNLTYRWCLKPHLPSILAFVEAVLIHRQSAYAISAKRVPKLIIGHLVIFDVLRKPKRIGLKA